MSLLAAALADALRRRHPFARVETLAGDASTRRFHRIFLEGGGTRVVMDYGAPFSGETDDVRLARLFVAAGLPVARVIDVLPEAGCLVLEDLGDLTLERAALDRSAAEKGVATLYERAIDLAAGIAASGTAALAASDRAAGPALDEERFRFEMDFFLENFLLRFRGRASVPAELRDALHALARRAAAHPRVLCHRDFHSRNLMVLPDGSLAMVDIQDARWGPDTYDVASLLRDAYADLDEAEVDRLLERFRLALADRSEAHELRERFHVAGTQRMIKALGTFGYQVGVLGRERYRSAVARTLTRLQTLLPSRPSTERLARLWSDLGGDVVP